MEASASSSSVALLQDIKEGNQQIDSNEEETNLPINNGKGGWRSAILLLGTSLGLNIASGAWYSNFIVFLISEFNVKNISAAQISNIFSGFNSFFPFIAAILADSAFGAFSIVLISSFVSLLGVAMFTFIVTIKSLKPPTCTPNSTCISPTTYQYTILYITLTCASLGHGGTRFLLGSMGADQFDKPKHQASFFNWFVVAIYVGFIVGSTLLIHIETSVSWALSFGIAVIANVIAIILFLAGSRLYRKFPPRGSPFTSIARVFVVAARNKNVLVPVHGDDCYFHESEDSKLAYEAPSKSLSCLNQAALIKQGEVSSVEKSWRQCTVEEVEDVKKLLKLMPIWSSSILLSGAFGVLLSFTVLMALVMDRRVSSHYEIPAGTFLVVTLIVTSITSSSLDQFIYPTYKKLTGRRLTYLQGLGVGHVSNILAAVAFALIERRRLQVVDTYNVTDHPNAVAPMSGLWLLFPLVIMGIGEGFYFSPEVALFYQEYPKSLRSTSTAMISLHIAGGFYMSSVFIDLVGRTSSWLPDDINFGRVDNACWVLAIVATLNYVYFLVCAILYKYNNPDNVLDDRDSRSS